MSYAAYSDTVDRVSASATESDKLDGKVILIVDDFAEVRGTYEYVFKRAGWRVLAVKDGAQAMTVIDDLELDAIILDIFMPDMDGIEVLLQARARLPNTAIVSVSGSSLGRPDMLNVALKFGADAAVLKSTPVAELVRIVDACVAARQS